MALIRDRILAAVKASPGIGIVAIAQVICVENNTVSGNISKLFTDGLVSRTGTHGKYRYTITAKGRADMRQREKLQNKSLCSPRSKSNQVISECRRNWQGYHIHKIFGSARQ